MEAPEPDTGDTTATDVPEASDRESASELDRGVRVLRLRLKGTDRDYEVDFCDEVTRERNPLSVIAGAFSTGKTSVLEFVSYCLGAKHHPQHPEVMRRVRSALVEVELSGQPYVIERAAGEPSSNAFVREGRLGDIDVAPTQRRPITPAGDPTSLSSLLLSHCGLEGVELREAPTQAESKTDPLSFRDLMWLSYMPNERLDDKNLLFESSHMKRLKLRQVMDVVFGVHDDRAVEIGRRIRELESRLTRARTEHQAAQDFLDEQSLGTRIQLEILREQSDAELALIDGALSGLDEDIRNVSTFAEGLREAHRRATTRARSAATSLRDLETQVRRLIPLRAQYADDITKLTMLAEAHRLFDPLRVRVCPACLTPLTQVAHIESGRCSLCRSATQDADGPDHNGHALTLNEPQPFDVSTELRATKARLSEVSKYIEEIENEIPRLRRELDEAAVVEREAAAELDRSTRETISPFLSRRDQLMRQRAATNAGAERARSGIRMLDSLDRRAANALRLENTLRSLRDEASNAPAQADREGVVRRISSRYTEILKSWRYPKIELSLIDANLVPHMRGSDYTNASSGGRTLISLAWILAIFEIAWESGAAHPGFLMIDSPQKNLGQGGDRDTEFADSVAVSDVYHHVQSWLAGPGVGSQIIIVDNAPPAVAEPDVVVRFSRRAETPPYGLISDETS
jgi:hypothetical protein